MGKKKRTCMERQREVAPSGVGDTLKRGIKEIQATVWKMRFLILIWATWMTMFLTYDSFRLALLMTHTSLWLIYLCADFARKWAWKLIILIWPQWILTLLLREERSVAQYAKKYELLEKHKKHRGGSVIFCSKYGIGVWRGFIEVIIGAHNQNKSWAGSFSLEDLRMSGHRCRIKLKPDFAGTHANLLLDLSRLAHLLISEFSHKGVPMNYVKLLYDDMINASALSPALTKRQLLDFLTNHPALKSPRQLTTFTSEVFQAYAVLGPAGMQTFDGFVTAVPVGNWVQRTQTINDKLLMKVLTYKKYHPHNTKSSYQPTSNELFRFLRNFQQHGGDRDVVTGAQNMFNMRDLQFIATYEYCSFICRLLHELLVQTDMKVMMLDLAWDNYTEYHPIWLDLAWDNYTEYHPI